MSLCIIFNAFEVRRAYMWVALYFAVTFKIKKQGFYKIETSKKKLHIEINSVVPTGPHLDIHLDID